MEDSIFTQIIKGEIPCHKVYEDEHTFAFLDIYPVQPGHTLVISKKQVASVWDLEPAEYAALMDTVKKLALHLREVLAVPYVGEVVEGVDVAHAHVHLVPFSTSEEFRNMPDRKIEPNHESLAEMAKKLAI